MSQVSQQQEVAVGVTADDEVVEVPAKRRKVESTKRKHILVQKSSVKELFTAPEGKKFVLVEFVQTGPNLKSDFVELWANRSSYVPFEGPLLELFNDHTRFIEFNGETGKWCKVDDEGYEVPVEVTTEVADAVDKYIADNDIGIPLVRGDMIVAAHFRSISERV